MVVDEARALQESIADCRAEKLEATSAHIFGYGIGKRRRRRDIGEMHKSVYDGAAIREKRRDIVEETAELRDHREESACIGDYRLDFKAVANDTGAEHQTVDIGISHSGDFMRVEIAERIAVGVTAPQDSNPRQPGLGALQGDKAEERIVVGDEAPPFIVVVGLIQLVATAPSATAINQIIHRHQ